MRTHMTAVEPRSRFLVLTKGSAASRDENDETHVATLRNVMHPARALASEETYASKGF